MNKLILKYYIPVKNELQNGILCSICERYLIPSKRCNSKDPFDIDRYGLLMAVHHVKRVHKKRNLVKV